MMKTKTITLKTFDELSKEEQEEVIEHYRDINTNYDWHDYLIEEWTEKLEKMGYQDVKILYSGFYSQGDGACFEAEVDIRTWLKKHKLATKYSLICQKADDWKITIKHNWRYYFSSSTKVDYEYWGENETTRQIEQIEEIIKLIEEDRERLGNEIYEELRSDYEGLMSKEAVAETLRINEYNFYGGKIWS